MNLWLVGTSLQNCSCEQQRSSSDVEVFGIPSLFIGGLFPRCVK